MTKAARLRALHQSKTRDHAADILQELVTRGEPVSCVNVCEGWRQIDTFEDHPRALAEIRK